MIKISQFPNISTRFRGLLCNLPVLRRSGQPDPHARRHLHPRRVLLCVWRLPLWTPSQLPYLLYQGHHHEHDLCNHRLLPFCIGWFCFPPDCDVWSCYKTKTFKEIREGVKKREKAVRLTAWVDPPSPEAVRKMWKILTLTFDFGLWLYMTYNKFYPTNFFLTTDPPLTPLPAGTRKKFGICQNFLTWPYKTTLKMHFSASSQWSKICFGYQGIIFNGKKGLKFSQIVLVRLEPDRFFTVFFLTASLTKL